MCADGSEGRQRNILNNFASLLVLGLVSVDMTLPVISGSLATRQIQTLSVSRSGQDPFKELQWCLFVYEQGIASKTSRSACCLPTYSAAGGVALTGSAAR